MSVPFLIDYARTHPTAAKHWYDTRREPILAEVVHITAGGQDLDMTADASAEQVAQYAATTDRSVSWHSSSDSDSAFELLPASATAWHCKGYNSCTAGHEVSKRDTDWATAELQNPAWVEKTLRRAASVQGPRAKAHKVPFRHATRADLDRARIDWARTKVASPVGFLGHCQLDPSRRSDPGLSGGKDTFPWARYLRYCDEAANPRPTTTKPAVTTSAAHPYMLPQGHWFGRPSPDPRNHSGYYSARDRELLAGWQKAMKAKGSRVNTDGHFTVVTMAIVNWHRLRHNLTPNGKLDAALWARTR